MQQKKIQIGVLIGRRFIRSRKILRKENPFFIDLPAMLKKRGAEVIYFSPSDLPARMPLFVYKAFNKYFSAAELARMDDFYRQVRDGRVFLINSMKFMAAVGDKWKLYRLLKDSPFAAMLPATVELKPAVPGKALTAAAVKQNYREFLLKPRRGSDGVGIHRVRKLNNKQLSFYLKDADDYILQKMIEVPKIRGRVFDVRVGLCKSNGRFEQLYAFVRAGAKNDFRSNLSQGGYVIPLAKARRHLGADVPERIFSQAQKIAARIEKSTGYANICCADFLADADGKIWFVEANSAPGWHWLYLLPRAERDKVLARVAAAVEQFYKQIVGGKKRKENV